LNKLFERCIDKDKAELAANLMKYQTDFIKILLDYIDNSYGRCNKASNVLDYCEEDLLTRVVNKSGVEPGTKIAKIFTHCLDHERFGNDNNNLAEKLTDINKNFLGEITRGYWKGGKV
jgi:hypothetical protein